MDPTHDTQQDKIPYDKLAEFFHASKSKARGNLVTAMYASQDVGFTISQCKHTGTQVSFTWTREVDIPIWAKESGTMTQIIELCFTGRDSVSILLRVYRGHCYNQVGWQTASMKKAVQVLRNPVETLS